MRIFRCAENVSRIGLKEGLGEGLEGGLEGGLEEELKKELELKQKYGLGDALETKLDGLVGCVLIVGDCDGTNSMPRRTLRRNSIEILIRIVVILIHLSLPSDKQSTATSSMQFTQLSNGLHSKSTTQLTLHRSKESINKTSIDLLLFHCNSFIE